MLSFPSEFPFVRRPAQAAPAPARESAVPDPRPIEPQVAVVEAPAPELIPMQKPIADPEPALPPEPAAPPPATLRAPLSPPTIAGGPRVIERRKVRRDPMAAAALVRLDSFHGPPAKVSLVDISIAGARFRTARPMEPGEKAQIRLEIGPIRCTTRLRIVHCNRDADGAHLVG